MRSTEEIQQEIEELEGKLESLHKQVQDLNEQIQRDLALNKQEILDDPSKKAYRASFRSRAQSIQKNRDKLEALGDVEQDILADIEKLKAEAEVSTLYQEFVGQINSGIENFSFLCEETRENYERLLTRSTGFIEGTIQILQELKSLQKLFSTLYDRAIVREQGLSLEDFFNGKVKLGEERTVNLKFLTEKASGFIDFLDMIPEISGSFVSDLNHKLEILDALKTRGIDSTNLVTNPNMDLVPREAKFAPTQTGQHSSKHKVYSATMVPPAPDLHKTPEEIQNERVMELTARALRRSTREDEQRNKKQEFVEIVENGLRRKITVEQYHAEQGITG